MKLAKKRIGDVQAQFGLPGFLLAERAALQGVTAVGMNDLFPFVSVSANQQGLASAGFFGGFVG